MNFEKVFHTVGTAFLAVFFMCGALVLTNKLNMWMVGLMALAISVVSFMLEYAATKNRRK